MRAWLRDLWSFRAVLWALCLRDIRGKYKQAALGLAFPGLYRDTDWIRAAWYGNDWVTLAAAAPLLWIASARAARGSVRGLLLWMGIAGYAVYNYAFYLFGAALNAFFLLVDRPEAYGLPPDPRLPSRNLVPSSLFSMLGGLLVGLLGIFHLRGRRAGEETRT